MLCIRNFNTNPYFNIAAEEHLLKSFSDDIFMLYRNEPSIIIGKHQNVFAEINYWFAKEKDIKVVRRLSGGGTVFHDLGNINFTFIHNGSEGNLVDFKKFTEPILQSLINLGIPASRNTRNDLQINGLKISGNAEHVYKKRVLHHGTLLYSSLLDDLKEGLRVNQENYTDRAVKSLRSPVANISHYLKEPISISDFMKSIESAIVANFNNFHFYSFSEKDINQITKLVKEKYETWEWNFAYSPKFSVSKAGIIDGAEITVELDVEKCFIANIEIKGEWQFKKVLKKELLNTKYREDEIMVKLNSIVTNTDISKLLKLLI